ncbi:hypothetical protein CCAX7_007230 [Capsulimonas corticalis]|uniref:Uncharacterized protein n=1 Tax=Capsulimonas corticalis TaxID=2219043 RepID=A0A402D1K6_9BACT|nr:hypothetical protein [Capsulimonas corticalis]BDI28672.1 hypothetical protein CCAX7_007230 [Capsulimonas corticalis]
MALSEEDRQKILQRKNLGVIDRWMLEECFEFQYSNLHMAHRVLECYINEQPIGDWMTTANVATHYCAYMTADIAAGVTPDSEASYHNKTSSACLLLLLSHWSSSIKYQIEDIRLLFQPPAEEDIDLDYVRFVGIVLDNQEVWKEVKPELRAGLKKSLKRLNVDESASLKTRKECRAALELIRERWKKRNGAA